MYFFLLTRGGAREWGSEECSGTCSKAPVADCTGAWLSLLRLAIEMRGYPPEPTPTESSVAGLVGLASCSACRFSASLAPLIISFGIAL